MGKTLIGSLTAATRRATIDSPIPFVSRGAQRALPFMRPAGMEAQMRAMGSVGTLFSIVNRTSNAVAQVDWKLWRKAKSGLKEDRVEVTSHAALDLWNKPNPFMPRQEFVETFQQHVDLVGEGWWVIARHPGATIPLELWPVRPDRMTPVPSQTSFLAGYIYTSPDGEQIPLELDEVIQLRMPNPLDPYRGMGPVQSILADLDATRYSAEWNRNFFLNSAEPGGIIEVPTPLSDPDFDQLRDRWNEQHRGVANAHRVAILEHGKWIDRKLSQRDMQFAELRSVSRTVIREAYGIPSFALGEVTDVNRATADASKAWFAEQLTVPRLERIKGALNHDLLPMFGATARDLEWDYENPVPPDPEAEAAQLVAKSTAAQSLIEAGAYGPEVLAAIGLPAIAFGQPGADPNRELLIKLVTRAPLLAPTILPMLGFDVPAAGAPAVSPSNSFKALAAQLLDDGAPNIDAAMRWVVVAEDDDNTCGPCAENDGKTYRNREQAYKDYPGGAGYVNCVGAEYGNDCRCTVVKRRAPKGDES
ncbi:phage portal protein [Streptomyces sp. wa1063]|uniref:phage portal protein n=1 Tax=Streptomyces sp. wa1063 TaxID=1828212 RepID=UPI000BEF2B65|nr:phage portal protein [Streptomyces sp. wa1063]